MRTCRRSPRCVSSFAADIVHLPAGQSVPDLVRIAAKSVYVTFIEMGSLMLQTLGFKARRQISCRSACFWKVPLKCVVPEVGDLIMAQHNSANTNRMNRYGQFAMAAFSLSVVAWFVGSALWQELRASNPWRATVWHQDLGESHRVLGTATKLTDCRRQIASYQAGLSTGGIDTTTMQYACLRRCWSLERGDLEVDGVCTVRRT